LPHTVPRLDLERGRTALPALQGFCRGAQAWIERGEAIAGNEGSRTLRIDWFGETLLLAGDAEAEGLRGWLTAAPSAGPTRLLLAPHHGSEIERLGLLLDRVQPAEVWITGPARPPIAGELDRRGIPWSSTGAAGPLRLDLAAPDDAACWNGACGIPAPPDPR
jgi:beta-lactamase superfamily II metal-dependent hydrolase